MEKPLIPKNGEFTLESAQSTGFINQFERALWQLTGLSFDLLDNSGSTTGFCAMHHEAGFCRQVHQSAAGRRACEYSGIAAAQKCRTNLKAVIQSCHLGLTEIYVPLIVDGVIIGILASGECLMNRPAVQQFQRLRRRLVALGLNPGRLKGDYMRLPVCPRDRIEGLVTLLTLINQYVADAQTRLKIMQTAKRENRIRRAMEFIDKHLGTHLRLTTVAAIVHLSPSRFAHLFRAVTGASFTDYVQLQRLHHAAVLLADSGLPIAAVAQTVGFDSQSHFNHLFKRHFKISPSAYRLRPVIRKSSPARK